MPHPKCLAHRCLQPEAQAFPSRSALRGSLAELVPWSQALPGLEPGIVPISCPCSGDAPQVACSRAKGQERWSALQQPVGAAVSC